MTKCRFDNDDISPNTPNSQLDQSGEPKKDRPRKATGKKKEAPKSDLCESLIFGVKLFPEIFPKIITLTLPIRTVSEANRSEPWQKRHKRHKTQKKIIFFELLPYKYLISIPCRLTFVRLAPKELDAHDNLPMSMKYICDQVCAEISGDYRPGKADSNKNFTIQYDQLKSKVYGVKIIIEF